MKKKSCNCSDADESKMMGKGKGKGMMANFGGKQAPPFAKKKAKKAK